MQKRRNPRQSALRAARVVTLGLVLAVPGACHSAHDRGERPTHVVDAGPTDDGGWVEDGGWLEDAGPFDDAGPVDDAGGIADAGRICALGDDVDEWLECCEAIDHDWERGCAAWGPFVPPADGEVA